MTWELVLQIVVVAIVLTLCAAFLIVGWTSRR